MIFRKIPCLVAVASLAACGHHGVQDVLPSMAQSTPAFGNASTPAVTIAIIARNNFETGSQATGFEFAGLMPQNVKLSASGSFNYALSSSAPAKIKIVKKKGTSDEFMLTPLDDASGITLTATATPAGGGKALKARVRLSIGSVLYVANKDGGSTGNGSVTEYVPWTTKPIVTVVTAIYQPIALAADHLGNVWVANYYNGASGMGTITEYAPGSKNVSRTISNLTAPYGTGAEPLAVDTLGDLYCACDNANEVDEYGPKGNSPLRSLTNTSSPTGINQPYSIVVDSKNNLYVANYGDDSIGVSVFAPGTSTTPVRTITSGISGAWLLALDKAGNLYAENYNASPNTVTEYAPGGSTVVKTFGSGGGLNSPYSLAVDPKGNVYAGNWASNLGANRANNVVEFSAANPAAPLRTFPNINYPLGLAVDPLGNVYAPASYIGSRVRVYPPGTSEKVQYRLTAHVGVHDPYFVTTWP